MEATDFVGFSDDDLKNIQGLGLAGFKKDHSHLLFVRFTSQASGRALMTALSGRVASAWEVGRFNEVFAETRQRSGVENLEATWIGLGLSSAGLAQLGVDAGNELGAGAGTDAFVQGMVARAAAIGDTRPTDAPSNWLHPFNGSEPRIDALVILAGDDPDDLSRFVMEVVDTVSATGCELAYEEPGHALPSGREHFGFRDGGSQPAISGYDADPAPAEPAAVAPGEFVLGYADQSGHTATVGDLFKDGSFLVYRRLRQHVQEFRAALVAGIPSSDPPVTGPLLGAKVVGRWPSGAPLELNPTAEPGDGHESNAFSYAVDADGVIVPRFAHIRKANPRDETQPSPAEDPARHRMIRRGTSFGPPLPPDAGEDDGIERGLHFLCAVGDLDRQFEFVQRQWLNDPNFPNGSSANAGSPYGPPLTGVAADGPDPLVGEFDSGVTDTLHQPGGTHSFPALPDLVTLSAGEYFYLPALLAISRLANGASSSSPAVAAPDPPSAAQAPTASAPGPAQGPASSPL
jgi:Dyp-type peroxidase family